MAPDTLIDSLQRELTGRPELSFAVLFGSATAGDTFRDVDVAVWLDAAVRSRLDELAFGASLEAALSLATGHKVDVVILNEAPVILRYEASRGIPLLTLDREQWYTFLERTWDEYFDFLPVALRYLQEMRR
jgi:predicted nucleotidyltransferase